MPDEPTARDAKLIQYLNEAYGLEKELETVLSVHAKMTTRAPYKKRLQDHLKETKRHAREVQKRIKQLGGKAEAVDVPGPEIASEALSAATGMASRAVAFASGAVHQLRGTGEAERMLKNAKSELASEHKEIAQYTAIATLAEAVGDKETAQLAKTILREEERMAAFLTRQIPTLTRAVVTDEIPRAERDGGTTPGSRGGTATTRSRPAAARGGTGSARSAAGSGDSDPASRSRAGRSGSTRAGSTSGGRSSGGRSSGGASSGRSGGGGSNTT
jgi:ferritin-like metal-binding protein YciE